MKTISMWNTKTIGAAAALCLSAGIASAQQVEVVEIIKGDGDAECEMICELECELDGELHEELILGGTALHEIMLTGQPEVKVDSHITMIQKTDDDEVKIEIKGEDVRAWVNGDRVPSKQIKITDEKIRVLDKEGDTIAEFGRVGNMYFTGDGHSAEALGRQLGRVTRDGVAIQRRGAPGGGIVVERGNAPGGGYTIQRRGGPGGGAGDGIVWEGDGEDLNFSFDSDDFAFVQPENAPPVMVGINMGGLDSDDDRLWDLLDERDLGEDDVIQIIGVIDGLPAEKAGLREGDVIVRLDGDWGANSEKLRDVLMEKEPGDNLEVAVVRNGRLREINVKLSAYSAEKLGVPAITYFESEDGVPGAFAWRNSDEAASAIAQLQRELAAKQSIDAEELRVHIEALAKSLEAQQQNRFPGGGLSLDGLPRLRGLAPPGGGDQRFFVEPGTRVEGGIVSRGQSERLEKIEARLERLENRIDRLIAALENRERD